MRNPNWVNMKARFASTVSNYLEKAVDRPHKTALDRAGLWLAQRARWASNLSRTNQPGKAEVWRGLNDAGTQLTVGYVCDSAAELLRHPPYLRSILFPGAAAEIEARGSVPLLHMRPAAEMLARQVDLVVVERNCLLNWRPAHGQHIVVPNWIHLAVDLSPRRTLEEITSGMRGHRQNIRRIRKFGLTYQVRHDTPALEMFYHRMFLPTVSTRFQEVGKTKTLEELRWFFENGGLLLVYDASGEPVAGGLLLLRENRCYGIAAGVLDCSPILYEQGAMSAIYYFTMQWCYNNGFSHFDAGGSRPFSSDSLYNFKIRWGFQPIIDPWNSREWLFWAPNNAPVALDWLQAHPPVELPAE